MKKDITVQLKYRGSKLKIGAIMKNGKPLTDRQRQAVIEDLMHLTCRIAQ
jgi:hypothetical protein